MNTLTPPLARIPGRETGGNRNANGRIPRLEINDHLFHNGNESFPALAIDDPHVIRRTGHHLSDAAKLAKTLINNKTTHDLARIMNGKVCGKVSLGGKNPLASELTGGS